MIQLIAAPLIAFRRDSSGDVEDVAWRPVTVPAARPTSLTDAAKGGHEIGHVEAMLRVVQVLLRWALRVAEYLLHLIGLHEAAEAVTQTRARLGMSQLGRLSQAPRLTQARALVELARPVGEKGEEDEQPQLEFRPVAELTDRDLAEQLAIARKALALAGEERRSTLTRRIDSLEAEIRKRAPADQAVPVEAAQAQADPFEAAAKRFDAGFGRPSRAACLSAVPGLSARAPKPRPVDTLSKRDLAEQMEIARRAFATASEARRAVLVQRIAALATEFDRRLDIEALARDHAAKRATARAAVMPPAPQPVREQPATVMPIEAAPAAEVRARPAAQPVEVTPPEPAPVDPPKRVPRPLAEILAEMSVDELDAARHQTALTITHGQRRRAVVTAIQAARKAVASAKARADEAQARAAWWRPGSGGEAQQAQRALSREIRARDQALTHARDQGMKDISPKALASTLERFDAELERLMRGAEAMAAEATRRQAAEPAAKPVPVETTAQALQAAHREVQAAAERMARAQATGHPDTIAQAEDVRRRAEAALRAIEAARKAKVDADLARVVSRQSSAHTQHARQRGG